MSPGPGIGMSIAGLLGLLCVVGMVALIVYAMRRSTTAGVLSIVGIGFVAMVAAGFLLTARAVPHSTANVHISAPTPMTQADVEGNGATVAGKPQSQMQSNSRITSSTTTYGVKHDRRRMTMPNIVLSIISLAALFSLARVAVDGRKNVGYGPGARVMATLAFIGLCAMLASLSPMIR